MEKVKRTIVKLLAVIAVAVALLLCGVLLGCGIVQKPPDDDGAGNQVNTGTATKPNDETIADIEQDEYIRNDIYGRTISGLCIKAEIDEKEEYDIDSVTVDLLYGVDIKHFNYEMNATTFVDNGDDGHIYVCAFNTVDYVESSEGRYKTLNLSNLGENLSAIENGEVKGGALRIDEIPCKVTNEYDLGGTIYTGNNKFLNADVLYGTEYEGTVEHQPYKITCYKRSSVTIPRELFTSEEGRIEFGIYAFTSDEEGFYLNCWHHLGLSVFSDIGFNYKVVGDKVLLSDIILGEEFVFDGTKSMITPKMKARSNIKPVAEQAEVEAQSTVQCVGAEGTIRWKDERAHNHPTQYVKVSAYSKINDVLLGTSYTDVDGRYDIYFSRNDIQSDDVYICVYTAGEDIIVGDSRKVPYQYSTCDKIIPDFENGHAQIDIDIDMSERFGKALQISQAAITAARYAKEMNNNQSLPTVNVLYPYNNSYNGDLHGYIAYYYGNPACIYIPENSASSTAYSAWDDIMQAYGHHVQKYLGVGYLTNTRHGFHYNMSEHYYNDNNGGFSECIYKHVACIADSECKRYGIGVGWREGWADMFALMAQQYYATNLIDIIDDNSAFGNCAVGDGCYFSRSFSVNYDAEKKIITQYNLQDVFFGEDNEYSVLSFLWDLFDEYNEDEPFDRITISHKIMWSYFAEAQAGSLSEFVNYISDKLPRDYLASLLDQCQINVDNLTFDYNSANRPTFSWDSRGGSENYPNNMFELKVYNSNNGLIFSHANIRSSSYTVSDHEWNLLLNNYGNFYWTVDAYQIDDDKGGSCLTGPYIASLVTQRQIFEYMPTTSEMTGSIDSNNPIRVYKYVSSGYLLGDIVVVGANGLQVDCAVYGSSISASSLKGHDTGASFRLPYAFTTGGSTALICVSGVNGATGTFSIRIDNHSHTYDGLSPVDNNNHKKTCVCGGYVTEAHKFGSAYVKDQKYHAFKCACGYEKKTEHVFRLRNGKMVCLPCGYTKPVGQDIMSVGDLC